MQWEIVRDVVESGCKREYAAIAYLPLDQQRRVVRQHGQHAVGSWLDARAAIELDAGPVASLAGGGMRSVECGDRLEARRVT